MILEFEQNPKTHEKPQNPKTPGTLYDFQKNTT